MQEYSRKYLHELVRECGDRLFDDKMKYLVSRLLSITNCPTERKHELQTTINSFKAVYKRKWLLANSTENRFLLKNQEWLNEKIRLPVGLPGSSKRGRPKKDFCELSDRSKRRQTKDLRVNVSVDKLTYATQMSHRATGNKNTAHVIKEITKSPTRATKYRKAATIGLQNMTTTKKHSPEEALTIFVEANLTMNQYEILQKANKDVYPCYTYLQKAKQACYPVKYVGERFGEVKLQDLVNHTAERLCKYLEPVLETLNTQNKLFLLIYKWGCDGSNQAQYKQKFEDEKDCDHNLFMSSLVPLRLMQGNKIIWQNPVPSSPRFCRPIRMRFVKETKDVTMEEIEYVENQAQNLQATIINENIYISHELLPTMVDGKVCNAATETTSTMRCYICNKTSKSFNNLNEVGEENTEVFKFGLSILHARIRFFEFLLHLSYKIKAKVHRGRVTLKSEKKLIEQAKADIQSEFREKMGLLVDIPKVGFGNSNDGNTSRRFFNDAIEASYITGIKLELIDRFKIILEVLSSGHEVDYEKFSVYTMDTAQFYVINYNWQPMSPTVHKILIHSASVIKHALLPIGQLSEEAGEARNKQFRQYREGFSRKFSRTQCNEDVLNRLLLTSDPYISSIKPRIKKKKESFSKEALEFLIADNDF